MAGFTDSFIFDRSLFFVAMASLTVNSVRSMGGGDPAITGGKPPPPIRKIKICKFGSC